MSESTQSPGAAAPAKAPNPFATSEAVPWCNGCSYPQLVGKIQAALAQRYRPMEVVLVSDIGCIGIVDKLFACHTVHGLHGRSVPLATGLEMSHDNPALKVIVIIGDGGCSIGLQHLVEAARLNANLTVFAFDNQNYGMTGGQHSTFTLPAVKTVTTPAGNPFAAMDLVRLLEAFPGTMRARLTANDPRVPEVLGQALAHRGFAYVETLNFCSSYAGRHNPELALARAQKFSEAAGRSFGAWPGEERPVFRHQARPAPPEEAARQRLTPCFSHNLAAPLRLVLGGSAGGGVQTASGLFTRAAALAGLHFSLKSDYPVTVGKGHSTCEIVLSPAPILFSGIAQPDLAIVCTEDGRRVLGPLIAAAREVVYERTLALERGTPLDFLAHGGKNAAFHALLLLLRREGWFAEEALAHVVEELPQDKVRAAFVRMFSAAAS
jgi:pyruvate/2-oxoacid:ferredoxin oxidoreductase beta subunit